MAECCYYFNARTGSILWAALSMVVATVAIVVCGLLLNDWPDLEEQLDAEFTNERSKVPTFVFGLVITFLLVQVCRLFFAGLLLVGVLTERHKLAYPFLVFSIISVLYLIFNLLATVDLTLGNTWLVVANLGVSLLFIFLEIYCSLTVRQHYRQIRRSNRKNAKSQLQQPICRIEIEEVVDT